MGSLLKQKSESYFCQNEEDSLKMNGNIYDIRRILRINIRDDAHQMILRIITWILRDVTCNTVPKDRWLRKGLNMLKKKMDITIKENKIKIDYNPKNFLMDLGGNLIQPLFIHLRFLCRKC